MASKRSADASRAAVSTPSFPSPAHDPEFRAAFGIREGEQFPSREERLVELRRIERAYAERTDELGRSLHRQAVARLTEAGEHGPAEIEAPGEPPAPRPDWRFELDPGPAADSDPVYRAAFGSSGPEVGDEREEWLAEVRQIAQEYATREDEVGQRLYRRAVWALEQAGETLAGDEAPVQAAG